MKPLATVLFVVALILFGSVLVLTMRGIRRRAELIWAWLAMVAAILIAGHLGGGLSPPEFGGALSVGLLGSLLLEQTRAGSAISAFRGLGPRLSWTVLLSSGGAILFFTLLDDLAALGWILAACGYGITGYAFLRRIG